MEITSKFYHYNFNVVNLERSLNFYQEALGLIESRRITAEDGSYIIVYLTDSATKFYLELTWMQNHPQPYNLGEGEFHLCVRVDQDYEKTREFHKQMGCVCYENHDMGLYFISDPDGYWIEILETEKIKNIKYTSIRLAVVFIPIIALLLCGFLMPATTADGLHRTMGAWFFVVPACFKWMTISIIYLLLEGIHKYNKKDKKWKINLYITAALLILIAVAFSLIN